MNTLILKGTKVFYDLESKIIGRHPTNSNILESGSDNSLYMGLINNIDSINLINHIMGLSNIGEFNNKSIMMGFYGDPVEVQCNINKEGQLQYKIVGNGKMFELLEKYEKNIGVINRDKLLIMLDFNNNEIFFEESDEEFSSSKASKDKKKAEEEIKDIVDDCKKFVNPNEDVDGYIETKLNIRNNYVQKNFRKNLLVEFDGKCAICGINKKELLRASHILPYSKCPSVKEMVDYNNGLLLCVNHDVLFDKRYITFDKDNGKIQISNDINKKLYEILNISENITLESKYLTSKRKRYLSTHVLK